MKYVLTATVPPSFARAGFFAGSTMLLAILLLAISLVAGCSSAADTQMAELRKQLMLDAEPTGALTVLDVQEEYADDSAEKTGPRDVVLVGRVGGMKEPWTNGMAQFIVADPSLAGEAESHSAEDHDEENCPFCARAKQGADFDSTGLAVVRFHDANGKIIRYDARKLFGLAEDQTIVVRGKAEIDATGALVVTADGLFVRK